MSLTPIEPENEAAITLLLEQTRGTLVEAMKRSDLVQLSTIKAQAATVAEATKQLGLSKDIQFDAEEMVRRSEFWLGKAVRQGQGDGTVAVRGDNLRHLEVDHPDIEAPRPVTDFAKRGELYGSNRATGIFDVADGFETETEFEAALAEARSEGNLSRANVARKAKSAKNQRVITRDMRAEMIAQLAEQGLTSRQMSSKVSVSDETVRQIARDFDIDIPADRLVGRSRRIDWTDAVAKTISALEDTAEFIRGQIDLSQVDLTEADEWVSSLTNSIAALNRFKQQIKEKTHV